MQLTTAQLQLLDRVARSPDGARFKQLLCDMVADFDKAARKSRGEDVHRALGAADGLDKLVADLEGAAQSLARSEASTIRRPTPVARF